MLLYFLQQSEEFKTNFFFFLRTKAQPTFRYTVESSSQDYSSPALSVPFVPTILLSFSPSLILLHGEGNGTPLQYSCLENPMDGGAQQAAVHGVAKSRTRLSDFTFTHWRRKWQPTPVFLPGESQGRGAWWAVICGVAQKLNTTEVTSQYSPSGKLPVLYRYVIISHNYI